jgi:hypothetical protein
VSTDPKAIKNAKKSSNLKKLSKPKKLVAVVNIGDISPV